MAGYLSFCSQLILFHAYSKCPELSNPGRQPSNMYSFSVDHNIYVTGKGLHELTETNVKPSMRRVVKKGGGWGRSLTLTFTSIQPFSSVELAEKEREERKKMQSGQDCAEAAQRYYRRGCHSCFPL